MVCKSTGEINYNCVGVGRSTKTSRRRFLKRICPKTNLPSKAKYPRHRPCCHAATSEVLYGTCQPRSNLPEPQTAEPLQNQIFPELCNTSRMPRSFFLSSFLEQLSSVIFLTARVGHGDICYYSYAGGRLHSRFYSYCRVDCASWWVILSS